MTTITWTGAAHDGLFSDALNWSSNPALPGAIDDVVIAPGTSTAITSPSTPTIHSISLSANVTLTVNSFTSFVAGNGTNGAGIAGTVDIANGAALFFGGTVVNSGTINEVASGNTTEIQLTQNTTLTGGGHVILTANGSNFIFGQSGSFDLDNLNNTISGAGTIGDQQMVLTNAFVIDANDAGATLVINPNGGTTNTGTLEATSGGTLDLNTQVANAGGTVEATGAGSLLALQTTIFGGTVTAAGGGTVQSNDATLDGLPLHPVTNNATIQVPDNEFLTLFGTIVDNGALNLQPTANPTSVRIGSLFSPMVTLQGTGAIHLGNNPNSAIYGTQNNFQLINKSNTIDGAGLLGANQLILVNQAAGVINANQPNSGSPNGLLTIDTTGISINQGLMEATNTGGLLILNSLFNNAGGTLLASGATDFVRLQNADIEGGTLNSTTGGVIETTTGDRSDILDGLTTAAVNNKGTLLITDGSNLTFTGTITNTGTIAVASGVNSSQFVVGSPTVRLQGVGGQVVMSNNAANQIVSNAATYRLVNATNTISGAGEIGNGTIDMVLVNQALINANQALALTLETAGGIVINSGTLAGSGTGGLIISNTAVNSVVGNLTGTILASGGDVHLAGANIEGGNLVTAAGGVIDTTSGDHSSRLDGITTGAVSNKGSINIVDNSGLNLAGTINNTGTINLSSAGNSTAMIINSATVTLQGAGGQVILSNNAANDILGSAAPFQFINVNNTISGAGAIGNAKSTMFLVNQGLINANQSLGLTLETAGDTVTNSGTMKATGAGGLWITGSTVNNVFGALTGTILASGGEVHLTGANIEGGNLVTRLGGVIATTGGTLDSVLDGLTTGVVNNEGSFDISDNSSATLWGTINNTGTISLTSGGSITQLLIGSAAVTLQGGGQLTMSGNISNQILGNSNTFQFINVNNTISGAGVLGGGSNPFYLINKALIDANQSVALTVQTAGDTIANTGTMEATGTGELLISGSTVNNTVGGLAGTIESVGAAAQVRLQGADIQGGTLLTPSGGVIATLGGDRDSVLDGRTTGVVNNKGSLAISDNSSLTIFGTINNTGTIALTSAGSATQLLLANQAATLTGNGQVVLGDNPGNQILGNSTSNTLVNNGNTITGAGTITGVFQAGITKMDFVNQAGTLQGTGSNPLVITLGMGIGINKAGAWIIAKGTGGVQFNSGVFANAGFIEALGASLTFGSGAANTNLIEGQLLGGNWQAVSTGSGATLNMTGGAIVTDAAAIIVSGVNSTVQGGNGTSFAPIEQTLRTIAAGGQLQVLANRGYTTTLDLVDSGLVQLGGGVFHANSLTISTGGRVAGFGTISDPPVNNGVMEAQGGLLDITSTVTGSGTLQIDNASTLELGGSAAETASFAAGVGGTLRIDTAASFAGSITNVAVGDVIDLVNVAPASITSIQWKTNFPRLTLLHNTSTIVSYGSVTGAVANIDTIDHWVATSDGSGGTNLTLTAGASTGVITGGIAGAGGASGGITNGFGQGNDPSWIGGSGHNFDTAANWAPAVVPTATADAVIGSGFGVLSNSGSDAVNTLTVGTGSTLTIAGPAGSAFKVILGTDPAGIAGTVVVGDLNSLDLGGTIVNSGSLVLASAGDGPTSLVFTQPFNVLLGGGKVILGNPEGSRIFGAVNFTLTNVDNTISGAGQLGAADLIFSNAGTVNANQTNPLVLQAGGNLVTNTGTMEDTGTGGLLISGNTTIVNTGGSIFATGVGSHVDMDWATIEGGTVNGLIETLPNRNNPNSIDGVTSGPLINKGTVVVSDLTQLGLLGTINNAGTILEGQASTGGTTQILLNSPVVTLQGGGHLVMTNNGGNVIVGQSALDTLVNVNNTISGAGELGFGQMTLVNETHGVILGDQSPTFIQSGQLTIDTPASVVVNAGTLESTAAGGLLIRNTTVNNTGGTLGSAGTVEAVGAGAVVDIAGATIQGGRLASSGGGIIQTIVENFSVSGTLDGFSYTAVNNTGTVLVNDQTTLSLLGAINNAGTIVQDQESTGGNTSVRLDSQFVTLEGGGALRMSNNIGNEIFGHVAGNALINVNNTISGAGQLGAAQMTFINQTAGVVDANQPTDLVLNTSGIVTTNAGTLEATNGGTLILQNTTVNNRGGTILASGAGSVVGLESPNVATTIAGGLVIGSAPIQEQDRGGTLDGQSDGVLTIQGTVEIDNTDALSLIGTINNTGTILEAGGGRAGNTDLLINSQAVTLTGGGTVLMANSGAGNGNDRIVAGTSGLVLVNVNNTIAGAGQLTVNGNSLTVTNEAAGIINANLLAPLVIGGLGVTNLGTMEATSTAALNGGLLLLDTVVDNAGGTIKAVGSAGTLALAHVDLNSSAVQAGTLADQGGGVIQTVAGTSSALDGFSLGAVTLFSGSTFIVTNNSHLGLAGTINNAGTLRQSASSPFIGADTTTVQIFVASGQSVGTVTMTGAGQWVMSDNPNNVVNGNGGVLVNQGNTISGAGLFGDNSMSFTNNAGTLLASGINSLVLSLGISGFGTNNATMSATGAGGMVLEECVFTNNGIMAANDGSSITFQLGAVNTNLSEGVLVGGIWKALATGHGATLSMTGGPINVDDAVLVLSGAGSVIQAGSGGGLPQYAPIEQTLGSIVAGGQLQVLGGRSYSGTPGLENGGIIVLAGGTFHTNTLTVDAGAKITGFGVINDGFINAGTVVANGGTLALPGNARGVGRLQSNSGATLSLSGGANQAGTVANNGAIVITSAGKLALSGAFNGSGSVTDSGVLSFAAGVGMTDTGAVTVGGRLQIAGGAVQAGSLTVASGGVLFGFGTVSKAVANAGRIEANGGTLGVTGDVTGTGTLQADVGGTLVLNGATNTAAAALNNGTVTLGASASLHVTVSVNPASTGLFILNTAALLEVASDTGASNKMSFSGGSSTGKLAVDAVGLFGTNVGLGTYTGPLLENFGTLNAIDLKNLVFSAVTLDSYSTVTGLLQLHSGTTKATLDFQNSTLHNAAAGIAGFQKANDGFGGVLLTHN